MLALSEIGFVAMAFGFALIGAFDPGRDFASLATNPPPWQSTERTVFAADWLRITSSLITFEVCAYAFLNQMARTIVGSLLWVGSGRWSAIR